jgi:hypothetical protein
MLRDISRELDAGLGALLGGVEAILILSVLVVVVDAYFGTKSQLAADMPPGLLKDFTQAFNASETVKLLHGTTVPVTLAALGPLLPKDLSALLPDGLPTRLPFPFPSSRP